jgi:hypothetical protein
MSRRFLCFILLLIISFFLSCELFNGNDLAAKYFKIKVELITCPDTVTYGDTLVFKLDGYIGPDGCHSFSHFDEERSSHRSTLVVWGKRAPDPYCTQALVYLDGKEYKIKATLQGYYYLNIRQPDNSILKDSIFVE